MEENKFIPGIYNYCDRWCEHCNYTDRCLLFAQEQKRIKEHVEKGEDPFNFEVGLQDMKESFQKTIELIRKHAEEEGIDLNSVSHEEIRTVDPETDPMYILARKYTKLAYEFLKDFRKILKAEGVSLTERIDVVASPEHSIEELKKLAKYYQIVSWYHALISAKIFRAISKEITDDEEIKKIEQEDTEKSIQVAYLGLQKSMTALTKILKWNEKLEDSLLPLLATAEELSGVMDKEFPNHNKHKVIINADF